MSAAERGADPRRARMPRDVVPDPVAQPRPRPAWETTYSLSLVLVDAALISVAGYVALGRFGGGETVNGIPYAVLAVLLAPVWVLVLAVGRAYESRFVGVGSDEFRRVFDSSIRLLAAVATVAFVFRVPLSARLRRRWRSRSARCCSSSAGTARAASLHALRRRGKAVHNVLVVGTREGVEAVVQQMCDTPHAGLSVVGACVPDTERPVTAGGIDVPVYGVPMEAARAVAASGADTVAVAGGWAMGADGVRRLAWQLEGSGVDLVVAPVADQRRRPAHHDPPGRGAAAAARRRAGVHRLRAGS